MKRQLALITLCALWSCSDTDGDAGVLSCEPGPTASIPQLESGSCSGLAVHTVSEYNPTIPIGGIQVQINENAWVQTGADGTVCLDAVSGPYTARVFQSETFSSGLQLDDYWLLID
ncbi:MAG: hypothetical protein AAFQ82_23150, partial [Myxococcota bacterium]